MMADRVPHTDEPHIEIREEPKPRGAVNISFQRNSTRKLKYLEAEPKILGTTQIALAFFYTFHVVAMYVNSIAVPHNAVTAAFSVVAVVAGSLGIAAQNLHPPTLKACLGMQLVACMGSVISIIRHMYDPFFCAMEGLSNPICAHMYMFLIAEHEIQEARLDTDPTPPTFLAAIWKPQESFRQLQSLGKLLLAAHIAVSGTLAVYYCKVIECCSPSYSVPIITVERPADAH